MAETKKTTTKEVKLSPQVWEVPYNEDLIAQVLYVYLSNERKGTASAKGKGEVRGGGKKPWKQKGTGRARHGSIRSPLWVGGGVSFTPNERNWKKSINKKMIRKATAMMLSRRLKEEVIDFVKMDAEKELKDIRTTLDKSMGKKTLLVSENEKIGMAVRNMPSVTVVTPMKLNAKNIVGVKKLLIDEESVKILEERLTNGK